MYPDRYQRLYDSQIRNGMSPAQADVNIEETLRYVYQDNPVPLPASGAAPRTETASGAAGVTEPTYDQLVKMYGDVFAGTNNPEANLRALHADNVSQRTAPATQRPGTDVVPEFTSGARSHEYMNPSISTQNNEPENP